MLELYKRIKDERLRHGMTQTELAEKIGYSDKSMISYIENGKVDLTQSKILLFAEVFGVSASYLMGNDGTEESVPNYKNVIPITTKRYPVLGEIACGKPVFCNEEKESYVVAGTEINADFCLIAHGDSMIGARIHEADRFVEIPTFRAILCGTCHTLFLRFSRNTFFGINMHT